MPASPAHLETRSPAPTVAAIIVAAGTGSRAGGADTLPKQYRTLGGRAVIDRAVAAFTSHPAITSVLVIIHADHGALYAARVGSHPKLAAPVIGGATRQASVRAGLDALAALNPDFVMIHDAARPFVSADVIDRTVAALSEGAPAVLVAVPVIDTLKRTDATGTVIATVPREAMWAAQTPQAFPYAMISADHARAHAAGLTAFTDDAGIAEWAGHPVRIVAGDPGNAKLTTPADFLAAKARLTRLETPREGHPMADLGDVRVGTGYDVHRFEPGDHVTLCGVAIPHTARLNGHSDADVALHALTDAILGALGDGDIGQHFPPSDPRWRGAPSRLFLADAVARVRARGGMIAHCDVSIIAEAPRIGPHREAMRASIAAICGIDLARVGVKATTNETLGFIGRREGIAALASATVRLPWESLSP